MYFWFPRHNIHLWTRSLFFIFRFFNFTDRVASKCFWRFFFSSPLVKALLCSHVFVFDYDFDHCQWQHAHTLTCPSGDFDEHFLSPLLISSLLISVCASFVYLFVRWFSLQSKKSTVSFYYLSFHTSPVTFDFNEMGKKVYIISLFGL